MLETAIELSNGRVTGAELQQIIDIGKEMLQHPIDLLPFVPEAVEILGERYSLLIITKGDLFAQENKIARSGLAGHFPVIEIVSEKSEDTYRRLFRRNGIDPAGLIMIGNSLRSDVLPVVAAGARAVHLPYEYTWHHEATTAGEPSDRWMAVDNLQEFVTMLMEAE